MDPFRAAAFAAFVFASVGGAFAAEPSPGVGAAAGPRAAVGPSAEDPDRDDAGVFIWDAWAACDVVPVYSRDVVLHGAPTGDAEKDSLGFGLAGHDGCGAAR